MLASAVRSLFRRSSPRPFEKAMDALASAAGDKNPASEGPKPDPRSKTIWPAARLALVHQLWDAGYIFPGGEAETLRLTRPLGVSAAASLLIVGVGSGGAACAVTRNLGAWVTGMDSDPSLLAAARGLVTRAQLVKKVKIQAWDPNDPVFVAKSHHHCLALEPLRGGRPEPILVGLAQALKPGGQIVMTELVSAKPLEMSDPTVRRWAELEHREPANVVAGVSVTRMLARVGLDVRVAEDISQRHLEQAMLGWRVLLRELDRKPTPQEAVQLVREAELWLLRRRLVRDGRLRMMRWHAMSRSVIV